MLQFFISFNKVKIPAAFAQIKNCMHPETMALFILISCALNKKLMLSFQSVTPSAAHWCVARQFNFQLKGMSFIISGIIYSLSVNSLLWHNKTAAMSRIRG